ncbi:MAG: FtsQ-type POTRA domain-containing protein [Treponema sp.]|nr:FtsQ-type POTRA domain-containing protein [Treponema sp.]
MAQDYMQAPVAISKRFEKFLRIFIVVAVVCLSGELIWLLGITPFRPFMRIDISGYEGLPRAAVLNQAGISSRSSFFSTDAAKIEQALMSFSSLESVKVFKRFPDRLHIILEGRRPLAYAFAIQNGRSIPVLLDGNAVIFRMGGMDGAFPSSLPVISGFIIEDPFVGMKLPSLFAPFFDELEKINLSAPELLAAVSEIRVSPRAFSGFDMILYPAHSGIKVRVSELNEDTLRYTLLMVDVLASRGDEIDSLDFRSGIASYILKEASFE